MKILHVTPFYPPAVGGISSHVDKLAKLTIDSGNDFFVICPKGKLENHNEEPQTIRRIQSVFLPPWPYPTLRNLNIPTDFGYSVNKFIKEVRPDVVHVHGHHYPISWAGLVISNRQGIPNVLTLHGMYALNPARVEGQTKIEELFNLTIFRLVLNRTSAVIGLTNKVTAYAQRYGTNEKTAYYTIPNGIDTLPYKINRDKKRVFREKYKIKESSIVIIFVGRFEEVKGIIEFCRATVKLLEKIPKTIEVLIVGDGPLKNEVNIIIEGKSQIHVFGWQPSHLLHELYISSDIFVIPSKFEAFGTTNIEAMNAGLHILFTAVGGLVEILENYANKTQLNGPTVEDIYNGLSLVISNSTYAGGNMESRKFAESFDWKHIFPEILNIYKTLVR
jgi:glycosyltransferase involved in cell wall biosynthesis